MTYADAVLRLVNHANLPGGELPMEESLLGALWIASQGRPPPDIDPLVNDVIACLEVVNRELNGPIPSETIERVSEGVIVRVAYPISLIVDGLLQSNRRTDGTPSGGVNCEGAIEAAFRINFAWCQVLAGDIDDIREEIRLELEAR
jgi:hypothetical protein